MIIQDVYELTHFNS